MFTSLCQKNLSYFTFLGQQYRMHPWIAQFPNYYFYEGKILDSVTESERKSSFKPFDKSPVSFISCETQEDEEV